MDKIEWGWFTPVDSDSEQVGTYLPEIPPTIDYIVETIKATEDAGFDIVIVPTLFINSTYAKEAPRAEPSPRP